MCVSCTILYDEDYLSIQKNDIDLGYISALWSAGVSYGNSKNCFIHKPEHSSVKYRSNPKPKPKFEIHFYICIRQEMFNPGI